MIAAARQWLGLTVANSTFINYDRSNMIAVAGFAKALPPHGSGYDFRNAGAMETRFSAIQWIESSTRVRWRWANEALFVDVDGSFTGHGAGSAVLENPMVSNANAFPECYQDVRYGGTVCGPELQFVQMGLLPREGDPFEFGPFCNRRCLLLRTMLTPRPASNPNLAADPALIVDDMSASYHYASKSSNYVTADDTQYLRSKFYPQGLYQLVELDLAADVLRPTVVGWRRGDITPWTTSTGTWTGTRQMHFSVAFIDEFTQLPDTRTLVAELSEDDATLTWVNGSDLRYGLHQLFTHVPWVRCELRPADCVGKVQYGEMARHHAARMNLANTPHFEGSQFQWLLPKNRQYIIDLHGKSPQTKM